MLPLFQRCIEEDHGESWCDFWLLLENAALRPVRRLLRRFAIDPVEAEDRVQDIFVVLQEDDMKKLRSFNGDTQAELAVWLKKIAVNHTLNWLKERFRRQSHEQTAIAAHQEQTARRGSEQKLVDLVLDLKANLNPTEIDRVEILLGIKPPHRPLAKRTLRRWQKQLCDKFRAGGK